MAVDPFALVQASVAQNNSWSAQQAQKQMDFQERMSNTAHQREIADLKAAGLNPVLSARLGGAETPSGAMGTTDTSGTQALIEALKEFGEGLINSAAGVARAGSGTSSTDGSESAKRVNSVYTVNKNSDGFAGYSLPSSKMDVVGAISASLPSSARKFLSQVKDNPFVKFFSETAKGVADKVSIPKIAKEAKRSGNYGYTSSGRALIPLDDGTSLVLTQKQTDKYMPIDAVTY